MSDDLKGHATDAEWLSFLQHHPADKVKAAHAEILRLRAENEALREQYNAGVAAWNPVYEIVLNERDTLKAENEKLRVALRSLINAAEEITDDGMSHSERDWWFGELKAAFDALGDKG